MSKIKKIIESLPSVEQKRLQEAFDSRNSYFVRYPEDNYIGVNVEQIPMLVEIEKIGNWSLGRIKK